ncbi:MAG: AAA family ATPase [Bacteroidaceae bacterium]|nr:AAA family ATPase [Bacteroidaceae bacterium]
MICQHCHKENRSSARFCKWCGKALEHDANPLDQVIGRDDVKAQLKSVVDTYAFLRSRRETQDIRLGADTIIIGESGTGKTMLAQVICDYFFQNKIISQQNLTMVDAVDYERFVANWDDNISRARGGLLFFDNVQKLLPDSYSSQVNPLDKLFVAMDAWRGDPIVVLAGLPGGLEQFFDNNPSARNRFKYVLRLQPYSFDEMTALCRHALKTNFGLEEYTPEAAKKLQRFFKHKCKTRDASFGNGHLAQQQAEEVFASFISRGISNDNLLVLEEDIRGDVPKEQTLDEVLAELDDFVGCQAVKQAVREIAWEVQAEMQRRQRGIGTGAKPSLHLVLTGNPGTGKTTIARKLGEILEAVGYLDSGHVVEVDRSQMVSQYAGETPKVVDRLCDKAMGGILFIDEAYTLAPVRQDGTKDELGTQALEKLMKRMEDDRGRFVVIAAGYQAEMENLFRVNPGMRSRFNRFIHIDDYSADELLLILKSFVARTDYRMNAEAETRARAAIGAMYDTRDNTFANGRAVRALFEKMCARQAERVHRLKPSEMTDEALLTFIASDVPFDDPVAIDFHDILRRFDDLVGLENVKAEVTNLCNYIAMEIRREGKAAVGGRHYVFSGNPGTGKTTVARIMAEVLQAMGIISRGQLVEADRSSLVAGFVGQTAIKTNQLVDKALGGVLFIDEAYTLTSSDLDTFGKEAVDTLLKRLEDDRGKFVCIIAGYPAEMDAFLSTNPGLRSRFTQTIHFADYSAAQLADIFFNLCKAKHFTLSTTTREGVLRFFERMHAQRTSTFGNAREVRRAFDSAVANQSRRLMQEITDTTAYDAGKMYELTLRDIEGDDSSRIRPIDEVTRAMDRDFIGMDDVKETIRRLAAQTMFLRDRAKMGLGAVEMPVVNIILTGNPGTGKTTITRTLGQVLQSVGLLPTSKVIECDRSTLVGKYMGETPRLVNSYVERAMGGILFIDEAYTLSQDNDQYGREAIETLMKRMEDDAGKFVVVAAGYRQPMQQFLDTNPGLASRFNYRLHINDYTAPELVRIFELMVSKKNYELTPEAQTAMYTCIRNMYDHRQSNFGNARAIRNLFAQTIQNLSVRVAEMPEHERNADAFRIIRPEDFPTSL